jgi:hypothetical protein
MTDPNTLPAEPVDWLEAVVLRDFNRRLSVGERGAPAPAVQSAAPDTGVQVAVERRLAASNGDAGNPEVLAATSLTDAQWNIVINALLAAGTVTKTGAARGTRYHLTTDD